MKKNPTTIGELYQRLSAQLSRMEKLIKKEVGTLAGELDNLTKAVTDDETVQDSAITLMTQLSALLVAAKNDPAKVQALADSLNAKKQALADAITANTPAA